MHMGQEKSRQGKKAEDTAKGGAGAVLLPYPPKAEEYCPDQQANTAKQLSRKRQEKPREAREGKAEAAEEQRSVAEDMHREAPFGIFTQIIPQNPTRVNRNFMQKHKDKFSENSCNLRGSMV
jgi:hypothetical protein